MKKFLAWVVFVPSVVSLINLALRYHGGKSTVLVDLVKDGSLENVTGFGNELLIWLVVALGLFFWNKWK
jgi:hypothetical protein